MSTRFLIPALLATLFLYACSAPQSQPAEQLASTVPATFQDVIEPIPEPIPVQTEPSLGTTAPPTCWGDEVSPIGRAIADEYESVSYEQVITWFCNGAEFEDIIVALESESQTGTPAEEMLQMLADGFTWDEIWQIIGLSEGDQ